MDEDIEVIETSAAAAGKAGVVMTTPQSTVSVDTDSEEETVTVVGSGEASSLLTQPSKRIDLTRALKKRQNKTMIH